MTALLFARWQSRCDGVRLPECLGESPHASQDAQGCGKCTFPVRKMRWHCSAAVLPDLSAPPRRAVCVGGNAAAAMPPAGYRFSAANARPRVPPLQPKTQGRRRRRRMGRHIPILILSEDLHMTTVPSIDKGRHGFSGLKPHRTSFSSLAG